MIIFKLFTGLVVIFLLVAFAIRNMTPVHLDFYFYKTPDIPLFVMLYLSILLGVAVAWLLVISEQLRMRIQIKKKDKRIKELEERLKELEKTEETPQQEEEHAASEGV